MKLVLFATMICVLVVGLGNCKPMQTKVTAVSDPLAVDRAKYIAVVNRDIQGRESVAVDSVFKNLKVLGGFPAENLVFAMEKWSEALGVSCDHCHVLNEWHQDVKPEKEIARQMVTFGQKVNEELRKIQGLKSEKPLVNCYSCHHGEVKPAKRKAQ